MSFIEQYDWLIWLLLGSIIVLAIRHDLHLHGRLATARALLLSNLPWLAAGVGHALHPERDSFDLYDLRLGAIAYLQIGSMVAVWVSLLYWLFRLNGAELLAESEGTRKFLRLPSNPSSIKLLAIACVLGGILGLASGVMMATEQPR